ncbi:hypothetical protein [Xanthomonas sp. SI]|uniref:hypothetical protein n=1 Tax=Xanthomonas sp. SI TaxID=2724123 RepID=UPI00163A5257|nr:hypothetical protein [Xanthomonas sp. SI]QNH11792.1 hypothetical protein HEP75_01214 [Xanthomonas sp. SI]
MINKSSSISLDTELQQLTARLLSPRSRYGHMALLLAALMMCVLLGALLATEPALSDRTQAALVVMLCIGSCWVAYAFWVLRQRRPLLANHRIVAGWMAVAFTAVFAAGALGMTVATGSATFYAAAAAGVGMLVLAVAVLVRAYRHVAWLQARRLELERQIREQE